MVRCINIKKSYKLAQDMFTWGINDTHYSASWGWSGVEWGLNANSFSICYFGVLNVVKWIITNKFNFTFLKPFEMFYNQFSQIIKFVR